MSGLILLCVRLLLPPATNPFPPSGPSPLLVNICLGVQMLELSYRARPCFSVLRSFQHLQFPHCFWIFQFGCVCQVLLSEEPVRLTPGGRVRHGLNGVRSSLPQFS